MGYAPVSKVLSTYTRMEELALPLAQLQVELVIHCSDPRARSDRNGESEPKPGDARFISFYLHFITFLKKKSVATRIPGLTRMADSNQSPVYFDVFIYLIKTFYYVISLRKRFQF